jgi:hypothetical protein
VSVTLEVLTELQRLRTRMPAVTGSLVATLDGLLIAEDTGDVEPEGVAALTAAAIGLGRRIAATVQHGDLHEVVIWSAGGCLGTYAAGPRALLAVLARADANAIRLNSEARTVAERVTAIIDVLDVLDFAELAGVDGADLAGRDRTRAGPADGQRPDSAGPSPDLPRRAPANPR